MYVPKMQQCEMKGSLYGPINLRPNTVNRRYVPHKPTIQRYKWEAVHAAYLRLAAI
jgi:hypothetical protein